LSVEVEGKHQEKHEFEIEEEDREFDRFMEDVGKTLARFYAAS